MSDLEDLIAPWVSSDEEREALAVAIEQLMKPPASSSAAGPTGVHDANHALLVGRILGALVRADVYDPNFPQQLRPTPVMVTSPNGHDYTNKITVTQPSGTYVITVEPA